MMVVKRLSITMDSEIEDIIRLANEKGIIDCGKVTVRHCEPGIMYTLDCKSSRIKAVKSTIKDTEKWVVYEMK